MSKDIEEIKVCTGCDRFSDDPINDSYIGCCPDNNYVPLKDEFRVQQQKIKQLEKEVELKNNMLKEASNNALIKFNQLEFAEEENTKLKDIINKHCNHCSF